MDMKKKQIDKSVKETRAERNEARRYAEQLKCERDEARAAYEAETASTIELLKRIMQLESEANLWRNRHSELFMQVNPPLASESQREAAGTANEKPDFDNLLT